MSPYIPPRESFLVIDPWMVRPGEGLADLVERIERSVQDGICPDCQFPLILVDGGMTWACNECGYEHRLPYPSPIIN